jgi:hypothetical protein
VAGLALIMRISSVFSVWETIDLIPSKFHAIPVIELLGNERAVAQPTKLFCFNVSDSRS